MADDKKDRPKPAQEKPTKREKSDHRAGSDIAKDHKWKDKHTQVTDWDKPIKPKKI
jgi:hypothetical protein